MTSKHAGIALKGARSGRMQDRDFGCPLRRWVWCPSTVGFMSEPDFMFAMNAISFATALRSSRSCSRGRLRQRALSASSGSDRVARRVLFERYRRNGGSAVWRRPCSNGVLCGFALTVPQCCMARGVRCVEPDAAWRCLPNRGWADRSMRAGVGATAFGGRLRQACSPLWRWSFRPACSCDSSACLVCRARRASSGEPRRSLLSLQAFLSPCSCSWALWASCTPRYWLAVRRASYRRCEHVDAAGGGHGDHRVGGRAHHATSRSHGRLQRVVCPRCWRSSSLLSFFGEAPGGLAWFVMVTSRRTRHEVFLLFTVDRTHVAHVELCAVKRVPGSGPGLFSVIGPSRRRSGRAQRRLRAVVVDAARVRGHLPGWLSCWWSRCAARIRRTRSRRGGEGAPSADTVYPLSTTRWAGRRRRWGGAVRTSTLSRERARYWLLWHAAVQPSSSPKSWSFPRTPRGPTSQARLRENRRVSTPKQELMSVVEQQRGRSR